MEEGNALLHVGSGHGMVVVVAVVAVVTVSGGGQEVGGGVVGRSRDQTQVVGE